MTKHKKKVKKNKDEVDGLKRDIPLYPDQKLKLTIPIPPSVNHAYIRCKNGKVILSKDAKLFVHNAQITCQEIIDEQEWKKDNPSVWYYMDMYFFFPDKRLRDSHNCLKVLMDTLEHVLYENDYFILTRIQDVQLDRNNPRLEILYSAKPISQEVL